MYHLAGTADRHDRGKVGTMFARQVRLIKTRICSPAPPPVRKGGGSPIHVEIYLEKALKTNLSIYERFIPFRRYNVFYKLALLSPPRIVWIYF